MDGLSYYDFDANWPMFLQVWEDPEVQQALILDIQFWKELGFFKKYKQGDPLWKETRTTYWIGKCVELAHERAKRESHVAMFKRTMSVVCPRLSKKNVYYKTCFGATIKDCEPKPNTIEWFVMPEGPFVFRRTMLACAKMLFPSNTINVCIISNRMTTIIDSKIVFDLFGFYFNKYDKDVRYYLS